MKTIAFDDEIAAAYTRIALANIGSEYPYKLDQLLQSAADLRAPSAQHPVFHGSYDWHSCVHMHWTLARALRLAPTHALADAARAHFDQRLTQSNVEQELSILEHSHRSFERPYGWGWLLKLAAELSMLATQAPQAERWSRTLQPLTALFAQRLEDFLPIATYPNRSGSHGNSAFALLLALDYAAALQRHELERAIKVCARRWFADDRDYPASYEPGGDDFLSGGLVEACLMHRVLNESEFADWWRGFAPNVDAWLEPATISDARDGKIVHLHGLNLSRAWCWRQLLAALPQTLVGDVEHAIAAHLAASLSAATEGDYVGTHWLASFALLALSED